MSAVKNLGKLLGFVKPMAGYVVLAVLLGVLGFVSAAAIPTLAVLGIGSVMGWNSMSLTTLFILFALCAVSRGLLRYGEQACNHYIAFKILAYIRDLVFGKLRELGPARMESKSKGDLISLITSDVELLEVFFAHTISPICIAIVFGIGAVAFGCWIHPIIGAMMACAYLLCGAAIPMLFAPACQKAGEKYRALAGKLSALALETTKGLKECVQYDQKDKRLAMMEDKTNKLFVLEKKLKDSQSSVSSACSAVVILSGFAVLFAAGMLYANGQIEAQKVLLAFVFTLSSFGPFLPLANLASGLAQTLGAARRVVALLEEEPVTKETLQGSAANPESTMAHGLHFAYSDGTPVLEDYHFHVSKGEMVGISGPSGCGKSTLLKLLMRFWDPNQGSITMSGEDLRGIQSDSLRKSQSLVTQDCVLFQASVADNLKVAKEDATQEEMTEACKKAAIHERIMALPDGYNTVLKENGTSLSAGERQRLSLARAFLHDADMLLLDEPTSNLDVLNEGAILQAIDKERKNKAVVLVSHRNASLGFADRMAFMTPVMKGEA